MKELRELKFEKLTTEQKIGLAMVCSLNSIDSENADYTLELTWCDNRGGYAALCECYEKGIISDKALDAAVKRVLATQHKVPEMQPKYDELTSEDIEGLEKINTDSVYAKTDDGVSVSIPKDSKNFFVVLSPNELSVMTM